MKTDPTVGIPSDTECSRADVIARLERAQISPWVPWVTSLALAVAFWVAEAAVHVWFFGSRSMSDAVFFPDGHELWMRLTVVAMFLGVAALWSMGLAQHRVYLAQAREHQARLATATHRFASGDAEDRRRIADRLHESVGQSLAAARLFLGSADFTGCAGAERDVVHTVERILDRTIADCRDVATELSPPVLDEYGLEPAIEALSRRLAVRTGTSVEFEPLGTGSPSLPRATLLATYSVLAEVIETAAADPETTAIRVTSSHVRDRLAVVVAWDGPAASDYYLACERMSGVGGSISRRGDGDGTEVVVLAPVTPAA